MGVRFWNSEELEIPRRRNKHLNDLLRSKRSEAHEPKRGQMVNRAKQKKQDRKLIEESFEDF